MCNEKAPVQQVAAAKALAKRRRLKKIKDAVPEAPGASLTAYGRNTITRAQKEVQRATLRVTVPEARHFVMWWAVPGATRSSRNTTAWGPLKARGVWGSSRAKSSSAMPAPASGRGRLKAAPEVQVDTSKLTLIGE